MSFCYKLTTTTLTTFRNNHWQTSPETPFWRETFSSPKTLAGRLFSRDFLANADGVEILAGRVLKFAPANHITCLTPEIILIRPQKLWPSWNIYST